MVYTKLFKNAERLVVENSAAILTGVGVVGTITTAVLAGKASYRASEIITDTKVDRINESMTKQEEVGELTVKEKVKLVWPLYIPAVGSAGTTITAIVFANKISTAKSAAMAAAYGLSEKGFQEYKEKVVEKFGNKKEEGIVDALSQDRVSKNPVDAQVVIIAGGDVLCYDSMSGRYFMSTIENVKKAENEINQEIYHHQYASLSSFYEKIGLDITEFSEQIGWNADNILEIRYSTTMSSDNRPCIVLNFQNQPVTDFGKFY